MCTVAEMLRRLEGLSLHNAAIETIEETKDEILRLNRDQLYHGFNKNGDYLRFYSISYKYEGHEYPSFYGKKYIDLKSSLNSMPGYGHPDLFLTGDFYRSFFVQVNNNGFAVGANDRKADGLEKKYKKTIFGLSPNSMSIYSKGAFLKVYKAKIRAQLGIKQ